jgi:hypothetical protein
MSRKKRKPIEATEGEVRETPDSQKESKPEGITISGLTYLLIIMAVSLVVFNQFQISQVHSKLGLAGSGTGSTSLGAAGDKDLSTVDFSELKSTGHSVAALFPLDNVETAQDAINVIIPTGTPEYGEELGVSYDDPVNSLNFMAKQLWSQMRKLKTEDPEVWQRYVNLASKPVGISCEYCCGVTSSAIRSDGESACGCQHNPALLALTVWLMENRPDWSDAEVLKEVLKWKALFFPRKMTELTIEVAGKDPSSLGELPGMVGGC